MAARTLPLHAQFVKSSLTFLVLRLVSRTGSRARYRENVLAPYADELGLGRNLVNSIDGLAALSSAAMVARLLAASSRRSDYLSRAATAIHELLERDGQAVPYYVFGHAHRAEEAALRRGSSGPRYLNSGTWSGPVPEGASRLQSPARRTFVEIVPDGDRPAAALFRWDDAAGLVEPVHLA